MQFFEAIGFGIVGGLILNVMPCVFPVLFFKFSSVIEHSDATPGELRRDGLAYLAGTLATFGGFAVLIMVLRASGDALGWGMQMQNAPFVAFLCALMFAFGLNALGVFQLRFSVSGGGASEGGWVSSFVDGALITLISTPCSAPFLGGAAGYALAGETTWWQTLLVFWAVGFGLALPVLAIAAFPRLVRLLPRPGAWMDTFKILTGFTLLGAAVWLYGVLMAQVAPDAAADFLWFLLGFGLVLFLLEKNANSASNSIRRHGIRAALVGALVGVGAVFLHFEAGHDARPVGGPVTVASSVVDGALAWTPYTEDVRTKAMSMNRPVFVDFTADWCTTCKVFEKTHINTQSMMSVFDETRVLAAKADLTKDEALWATLNALGRNGLPTYVIYLPDGTYDLLPEGPPLTLEDRLRESARRFPPAQFIN